MTPLTVRHAAAASPSLRGTGEAPAYELKCLVDEARAREVERWALDRLAPDPHGDPALGGAYRTTTLYCDTAALDVFRGSPGHRRHKFRLRRYGAEPTVYLERKSRWGDRVAKVRAIVGEAELGLLASPAVAAGWPGHGFHEQLAGRGLRPALRVVYDRTAFVAPEGGRLTLDRGVAAVPARKWSLERVDNGRSVLGGGVVVELKFHTALPALFKELLRDLRLTPGPTSKYRLGQVAWGARRDPAARGAGAPADLPPKG